MDWTSVINNFIGALPATLIASGGLWAAIHAAKKASKAAVEAAAGKAIAEKVEKATNGMSAALVVAAQKAGKENGVALEKLHQAQGAALHAKAVAEGYAKAVAEEALKAAGKAAGASEEKAKQIDAPPKP